MVPTLKLDESHEAGLLFRAAVTRSDSYPVAAALDGYDLAAIERDDVNESLRPEVVGPIVDHRTDAHARNRPRVRFSRCRCPLLRAAVSQRGLPHLPITSSCESPSEIKPPSHLSDDSEARDAVATPMRATVRARTAAEELIR